MTDLLAIFLIISAGYLLGRIRIKGVDLGTAGVLLVALVFGHFGVEIPSIVQNFGLVCFVTMLAPCTITLPSLGLTAITLPLTPLSSPEITITVSSVLT